jgi:mannose-1-phosphate guanylyltransferase
MKECRIKDHAWIQNSIIGWKSTVGRWSRLEGVSVLGEDVQIADEVLYDSCLAYF